LYNNSSTEITNMKKLMSDVLNDIKYNLSFMRHHQGQNELLCIY